MANATAANAEINRRKPRRQENQLWCTITVGNEGFPCTEFADVHPTKTQLKMYWSLLPLLNTPLFPAVVSRDRFLDILRQVIHTFFAPVTIYIKRNQLRKYLNLIHIHDLELKKDIAVTSLLLAIVNFLCYTVVENKYTKTFPFWYCQACSKCLSTRKKYLDSKLKFCNYFSTCNTLFRYLSTKVVLLLGRKRIVCAEFAGSCWHLMTGSGKIFSPGENIVVDESLVPFKGRAPFRKYIKASLGNGGWSFGVWPIPLLYSSSR